MTTTRVIVIRHRSNDGGEMPRRAGFRTKSDAIPHNMAPYGWELVDTTTVALTGTDVAEFGGDDAISRVLGLIGDLWPHERAVTTPGGSAGESGNDW